MKIEMKYEHLNKRIKNAELIFTFDFLIRLIFVLTSKIKKRGGMVVKKTE